MHEATPAWYKMLGAAMISSRMLGFPAPASTTSYLMACMQMINIKCKEQKPTHRICVVDVCAWSCQQAFHGSQVSVATGNR